MKASCHKTFCSLVNQIVGSDRRHRIYIMRREKYNWPTHWWCEPGRHVRLTPEGIIKAMKGSCSKGHVQVFECNLQTLKIKKIFDGENK